MKDTRLLSCACILLAASFAVTLRLASEWEAKLVIYPEGMDLARAQAADEDEEEGDDEADGTVIRNKTETGTSQRIWHAGAALNAEYHFINFNRDKLNV